MRGPLKWISSCENTPNVKMLDRLLELLKLIEKNDAIRDYKDDIIPAQHSDVIEAINLADALLISKHGDIDWYSVDVLRAEGYAVFPLEKDRFGWLIGGIATQKGTISFG
jgi:hypothetical protein